MTAEGLTAAVWCGQAGVPSDHFASRVTARKTVGLSEEWVRNTEPGESLNWTPRGRLRGRSWRSSCLVGPTAGGAEAGDPLTGGWEGRGKSRCFAGTGPCLEDFLGSPILASFLGLCAVGLTEGLTPSAQTP